MTTARRFRDAIRCRYRALVGDLARRGMIDEIPGRTSGEERVQMAAAAPGELDRSVEPVVLTGSLFPSWSAGPDPTFREPQTPTNYGTADVQQHISQTFRPSGALIVVGPQDVAHLDGRKVVDMLRTGDVRIIGGVENMAQLTCPHCGEVVDVFPRAAPSRTIWAEGVTQLDGGADNGKPGPRPGSGPSYFAAFALDPDGHNVEHRSLGVDGWLGRDGAQRDTDHRAGHLEGHADIRPHETQRDLADALAVFAEDVLALRLAHLLEDHLLGGLRGDAAEDVGPLGELDLHVDFRFLAVQLLRFLERDLGRRVGHFVDDVLGGEQIDLARLLVEARLQVLVRFVILPRGGEDRVLDRANDDIGFDALLFGECLDRLHEGV